MKKILVVFLMLVSGMLIAQDKYFLEPNIDKAVNPAMDFFNYANGMFIKANPIPASEHTYGIFNLVEDSVYEYLKNICIDAMNNPGSIKGSNVQKIGDFYFSGLDTVTLEKNKLKSINEWIEKIENIKNTTELLDLVSKMHRCGIGGLYSFYLAQDLKNSEVYSLYFSQGGIGLPERDYYFNTDERTKNIREKYPIHIANMLKFIGINDANVKAKIIYSIEESLANSSRKLEDLRDDYANYNKMSVKEFKKLTNGIDWEKIIKNYGLKNIGEVVIGQPEFFKAMAEMLDKYTIDDWKVYLKWNLINSTSDLLTDAIDNENFNFYGTVLSGTTEQRPRFKRIHDQTNSLLGEILGQEYVRLYFSPEDKERTKQIVQNMVSAFGSRIKKLDWMSVTTKQKALTKLGTMIKKIGYPDVWRDYSSLEISRESYAKNVMNARKWRFDFEISKYGKPVDRTEWGMNPQTYNAYYNPSNNEIVIPAAILTIPGKRMSEVDDAFLYGFIGASTIGHEMTHGFDDQGKNYDELGNLNGWWTVDDSIKFVARSQLMVEQFNNFVVLDSMHVNGKATLGENIADLGGLVIGFDAMKNTEDGQTNKEIGGFNADQRYFLGYAYSWAVYYRDETLARRIMTDVHSPAFLRVNAPMSNMDSFYKAFGVKQGDKLFRDEKVRVSIW